MKCPRCGKEGQITEMSLHTCIFPRPIYQMGGERTSEGILGPRNREESMHEEYEYNHEAARNAVNQSIPTNFDPWTRPTVQGLPIDPIRIERMPDGLVNYCYEYVQEGKVITLKHETKDGRVIGCVKKKQDQTFTMPDQTRAHLKSEFSANNVILGEGSPAELKSIADYSQNLIRDFIMPSAKPQLHPIEGSVYRPIHNRTDNTQSTTTTMTIEPSAIFPNRLHSQNINNIALDLLQGYTSIFDYARRNNSLSTNYDNTTTNNQPMTHFMNLVRENKDVIFTSMAVEELLSQWDTTSLSSAPKGLSKEELEKLPSSIYIETPQQELPSNQEDHCTICLLPFAEGEEVSILHCNHAYHSLCIKTWLKRIACCPLCKSAVQP